jgi:hypothetical protein
MKLLNKIGLIIFAASAAILTGYGVFELINSFFLGSDEPLLIRIGVTGLVFGVLLILIALVLERIKDKKSENFKL